MGEEQSFELRRRDLKSLVLDELLEPVDDVEVAFLVGAPDVEEAARSALSEDVPEIVATCCNALARSASRPAWLRETSAVALTRSPISCTP